MTRTTLNELKNRRLAAMTAAERDAFEATQEATRLAIDLGEHVRATWTTADGRARWNGESLAYWGVVLVADLAAEFDPMEIWLFGSVARGDDDGDSDVDLLVVLDEYNTRDAIDLKLRAARAASIPAPFEVSFTDASRMASRRRIAGTLERAVASEGHLKYTRA